MTASEPELTARFGDRWQIGLSDVGVWTAVRETDDRHHIRVIVAHTAGELLTKLEAADPGEP